MYWFKGCQTDSKYKHVYTLNPNKTTIISIKMEKKNFSKGFDSLKKSETSIVKEVITRRCKWGRVKKTNGEFQLFYMKKNGVRPVLEHSEKNINEILIVETTFRAFGIDAWTGETIKTA